MLNYKGGAESIPPGGRPTPCGKMSLRNKYEICTDCILYRTRKLQNFRFPSNRKQ